jgi:predicted NACHT family NTPase
MKNLANALDINTANLMTIDKIHITNFTHRWVESRKVTKADKLSKRESVKKKNTNSLLLTMLDLVFEETSEFPLNNAQFYSDGIEILLKQWDSNYDTERSDIYKKMSLQSKQDLLSYIALKTFTSGDYFFTQKVVEEYIGEYITNLPNTTTNSQEIKLNSQAVLKSIEAQHGVIVQQSKGIYSFSDLALHEYFTAREIVNSPTPQQLSQSLQNLVERLTENRWREVFLLLAGMLRNADYLLDSIKHRANALVAKDEILLHFLNWNTQKAVEIDAPYKSSAFRALSLEFILNLDFDFALALDNDFAYDIGLNTAHLHSYTQELKNCRFSKHQKQVLKRYYYANKLLVDCLNHARYVSRSVREDITENILIPLDIWQKAK